MSHLGHGSAMITDRDIFDRILLNKKHLYHFSFKILKQFFWLNISKSLSKKHATLSFITSWIEGAYFGFCPCNWLGFCLIPHRTDKSKRRIVGFGGKVLTDKKSARLFLGQFLIQPIILFFFVLIFLLSEWIWLENTVGGSLACQICPFLAKNSVRYYYCLK